MSVDTTENDAAIAWALAEGYELVKTLLVSF